MRKFATFTFAMLLAAVATSLPNTVEAKLRPFQHSTSCANPFDLQFTCQQKDTDFCVLVYKTSKNVLERIAKVIQIYSTVTISLQVLNFCPGDSPHCPDHKILARSEPLVYYKARKANSSEWLFYPQSLVKQLNKNIKVVYQTFDILIQVNAQQDFWFPESNKTIQPFQSSFDHTIAHEITHGLGFSSNWVHISSIDQHSSEEWLIPGLKTKEKTRIADWGLSIFDSLITDRSNNSFRFASDIQMFPASRVAVSDLSKRFRKHKIAVQASKEAFKQFTIPGNSQIDNLTLYTPTQWSTASSISHLSNIYANTSEFLMVPNSLKGKTLDKMISKFKKTGKMYEMYGPLTVELLGKLGYKVAGSEPFDIELDMEQFIESSASVNTVQALFFVAVLELLT